MRLPYQPSQTPALANACGTSWGRAAPHFGHTTELPWLQFIPWWSTVCPVSSVARTGPHNGVGTTAWVNLYQCGPASFSNVRGM